MNDPSADQRPSAASSSPGHIPGEAGIWLLIGSLGVLTSDADGRFANRSFLIGPDGEWLRQFTYGTPAADILSDLQTRF